MSGQQIILKSITLVTLFVIAFGFQNCANTSFSELPMEETERQQSVVIDCGTHQEGDVWEALSGSVEMAAACGAVPEVLEKFSNYECRSGLAVETGTRVGQVISRGDSSCVPETPKSCQGLPHGSTRWETAGTEEIQKKSCPMGPLFDVYAKERQVVCENGNLKPTGQTRRGELLMMAGSCPVVAPTKCEGIYSEGQTKTVSGGTTFEQRACPTGQTGMVTDTYSTNQLYVCKAGQFVLVSTSKGSLISSSSQCQVVVRPAYCEDTFTRDMCDIYHYLFGRWPDQAGAEYWVNDFNSKGIPRACWTPQVSGGTRNEDCEAHRSIHGVYPNSAMCPSSPRGDAYMARATSDCP